MSADRSRRQFLLDAGRLVAGAALAPGLAPEASVAAGKESLSIPPTQQYARGQNGYEPTRLSGFQAIRPPKYPDLIVQARTEVEVVEVLRYARARRTSVAVKGGGHNYTSSWLRDGGILLDVSNLRSVEIDAGTATVRAQPGIRAAELCTRLEEQGLAFPLAHSANVPIGGYLLGGGMGWNGETWGRMACFRVRAVDVITAAGERLTVDASSHPDLYWAARGAGPAFCAVATRFHLDAFPYPRGMRAAVYEFPLERAGDVGRWLQELSARRIPNLDLTLVLEPGEAGSPQCTASATCFAPDAAEARTVMQTVARAAPGGDADSSDRSRPITFDDLYQASRTAFLKRVAAENAWTSRPVEATERLVAAHRRAPAPRTVSIVNFQAARGPLPDAAYSPTGTGYVMWMADWDDPAEDTANFAWVQATTNELQPLASGCYVNECDFMQRPDRVRLCFPDAKRKRLRAIGSRYDPLGLLPSAFDLEPGSGEG
jgi:FAD/FMN-containing dehydrogenase